MKEIKDLILNISKGRSAAHAYIIEGPKSDARDHLLQELISGLGCLEIDLTYMQRSGTNSYRVEDAAAFIERLGMRPYGSCLIGVIEDAQCMTETVQNKLLKTLEEPGEDVIILLTAAKSDALIPTVRSRCSLIRMQAHEGYEYAEEDAPSTDFMEGAFMLLTQRTSFHEFRELLDKIVRTNEDAIKLISIAEDKLRCAMIEGKAMEFCVERIEMAEKASADIAGGMDRIKALKRLYLDYSDHTLSKA